MTKYHFAKEGGKVYQHGLTFCPDFLEFALTDKEALLLIEQIAYRLVRNLPVNVVWTGELREQAEKEEL